MKAVILVGGLGTRLRSAVPDVPKTMALVGGKPFLEYQINWLKKFGLFDIILCVGYKSEYIENYFGDGSILGVNITYSYEKELLGTAGAIKNAEDLINKETFLVLNGDTYAKIDFEKLIDFHQSHEGKFTIGLTKTEDQSRYGGVNINESSKITSFNEKIGGDYINGGVYVFDPEILNYIEKDKKVSIEKEVFPLLAEKGSLFGYVWDGYFIDMGVPESYKQLQNDILDSILVSEDHTLRDVMKEIDKSTLGIALVVDQDKRLKGLVTDGDIRRFIIKDDDLNVKIGKVMVKDPVTAKMDWPKDKIRNLMNSRIRHVPIIDNDGVVKDIVFHSDLQNDMLPSTGVVVRAKAPLRVSFAGGGTDVHYYFNDFGGYVLNASINKYCYGTLIKRNDGKIIIDSFDFDIIETLDSFNNIAYNGKLDLIKAVIKLMKPDFGFELHLRSDVPPGTGLGCSASIAAVVAGLLNYFKEEELDNYQLADLIYKAERGELGISGGYQDQYAAVFGGMNFMEFKKDEIVVHPLRISDNILNELNSNLFLCYIGERTISGNSLHQEMQEESCIENQKGTAKIISELQGIIDDYKKDDCKKDLANVTSLLEDIVKKQKKNGQDDLIKANDKLKEITLKMKSAMLKGKLEEFGELLHEGWENKKRTHNKISDNRIDSFYNIAIRNGALGGKILGAGNGGYLLLFCSPLKKNVVVKKLEEVGGKIMDFNFDDKGLVSWAVKK